jgi:hypothetical protein
VIGRLDVRTAFARAVCRWDNGVVSSKLATSADPAMTSSDRRERLRDEVVGPASIAFRFPDPSLAMSMITGSLTPPG